MKKRSIFVNGKIIQVKLVDLNTVEDEDGAKYEFINEHWVPQKGEVVHIPPGKVGDMVTIGKITYQYQLQEDGTVRRVPVNDYQPVNKLSLKKRSGYSSRGSLGRGL